MTREDLRALRELANASVDKYERTPVMGEAYGTLLLRLLDEHDALREAAGNALEVIEALQAGCTDSDDGTVEAITVHCPEVIAALRDALGDRA